MYKVEVKLQPWLLAEGTISAMFKEEEIDYPLFMVSVVSIVE